MENYSNLVTELIIKSNGESPRTDRTGTGTFSKFGAMLEFDLREGFPLLTLREINPLVMFAEVCWFLLGRTDLAYLKSYGCGYWDKFAGKESGDIGPMYGHLWRGYGPSKFDQISNVINLLKNDPFSRRIMVISDDPSNNPDTSMSPSDNADAGRQSLGACHPLFQCRVDEVDGVKYLDLLFYMRSSDVFLGLPINIATYATVCHILAKVTGMVPRRLIYMGGDVHLYSNHVEHAKVLVSRESKPLGTFDITDSKLDFHAGQWDLLDPYTLMSSLTGYTHWPRIAVKISV